MSEGAHGRAADPARAALAWGGAMLSLAIMALLAAGIIRSFTSVSSTSEDAPTAMFDVALLVRTFSTALAIAALATILALPAAWSMRRLPVRWTMLLFVPLLLPNYLVYAAASLLRAPGTRLGNFLEGGGVATWSAVNHAQAIIGLALWSWPLAAIVIGSAARSIDRSIIDSLRLSGAPAWRRAFTIAAMLRRAILSAGAIVALLMLGSAAPLHLANLDTLSVALWRRMNEGAPAATVWMSAAPLILLALAAGSLVASRLLVTRQVDPPEQTRDQSASRACTVLAAVTWIASALLPLALFATNLRSFAPLRTFWSFASEPAGHGALTALFVGGVSAIIALATALGLDAPERSLTFRVTHLSLRLWLIAAFIPGVLIGAAILSTANAPALNFLAETRAGLIAAHLARFGAVAALIGWWMHAGEPRVLADLRLMYGGSTLAGWFRTAGAVQAPALAAAAVAGFLLSLHEIESSVIIAAPGTSGLSQHMLALLHYLRDDQLSAGVVYLCGGGLALALVSALLAGRVRTGFARSSTTAALLMLAVVLIGCDRSAPATGEGRALPTRGIFGEPGQGEGQFVTPRCIDADADSIWVIDKTARIQRFALNGEFQGAWRMPAYAKGMPTGVTCRQDGLLYIADTHEHRVLVCDSGVSSPRSSRRARSGEGDKDKNEMKTVCSAAALAPISATSPPLSVVTCFGSYGEGPGEFIYPTDVAILIGADGVTPTRYYVSEYGGNDRISVFDAAHQFLFSFGEPGSAADDPTAILFSRPQSIAIDREAGELLVADAANHRLGRFTLDGVLIAWIGRDHGSGLAGRALGEFAYPYGLALLPGRRAIVSEYGNSRVQIIDLDTGAGLQILGEPGRAKGQLVTPWGVATQGESIFILDTGNHRVQTLSHQSLSLAPIQNQIFASALHSDSSPIKWALDGCQRRQPLVANRSDSAHEIGGRSDAREPRSPDFTGEINTQSSNPDAFASGNHRAPPSGAKGSAVGGVTKSEGTQ